MSASKGLLSDIVGNITHAPDYRSKFDVSEIIGAMRPVPPADIIEDIALTVAEQVRNLRPGQKLVIERCEQSNPSDPGFTVTFTDVVDGDPE